MRVTITGATGLIGSALTKALTDRGDEVTILSRDPEKARAELGAGLEAHAWDLKAEAVPAAALEGRDAVVHLAGENVGQRWGGDVKDEILESRRQGTSNVVAGIAATTVRPRMLVCSSASGFYGPRGDEPVDETAPAGEDFLAEVCKVWEAEAERAAEHGLKVVRMRTGIVLDADDGALSQMLLPFKAGVGGPVGGGRQYMPWIALVDIVGLYLAVLDHPTVSGPVNGSAPNPVTNKAFSKALGNVLGRPSFAPVPKLAIKALYGEMSTIVLNGVNMVPGRADELGYGFRHTEIEPALRATLGR